MSALDLVVLVADKDMECTLQALLKRHQAIGMRQITFQVASHPQKDSGVYREAEKLLRTYIGDAAHAIAIHDYHGCGQEHRLSFATVEQRVKGRLVSNGWSTSNCESICIDPELERWVWPATPHVLMALGWSGTMSDLTAWLKTTHNITMGANGKPADPKDAMEKTLRFKKTQKSSSLFSKMARTASFQQCQDRAFQKLRTTLQAWFPSEPR